MHLIKIVTASQWATAKEAGVFRGFGIDVDDGFIHLSSADQYEETLAKHFAGQIDLVRLSINRSLLGDTLRWEASRDGALFPHVYGDIPLSAIDKVTEI